ncbi:MAG TPA: thioredoxin domain-containing protein [Solirubrobacterales bacterium]|nr:thioredoxin domain-containing protein [Solirubrobacterales bacterium]
MPIDTAEADFQRDVIERSKEVPVVVDFWAEWCGPCRQLGPALEAAESKRDGEVVLAKVDTDANQALAARYEIQGIPAVKAFRDGEVVDEFVGAVPPAEVEAFFDGLAPSRADELLAAGDELSLREAHELEPRRADIAVALAKARLARGAGVEALAAVEGFPDDFAAAGIAARVRLSEAGVASDAWTALDAGDRTAALDALLEALSAPDGAEPAAGGGDAATGAAPEARTASLDPATRRDLIRRAVIGLLADLDPADPEARTYRRKLSAAL